MKPVDGRVSGSFVPRPLLLYSQRRASHLRPLRSPIITKLTINTLDMRPPMPPRASTFKMINRTDLYATQATQQSNNAIPTFSSTKVQTMLAFDKSVSPPSSMENYLTDDFQSNSGSRSASERPATSNPPLSGLGILYYEDKGILKAEDTGDQDYSFFADSNTSYGNGEQSDSKHFFADVEKFDLLRSDLYLSDKVALEDTFDNFMHAGTSLSRSGGSPSHICQE